MNDETPRNVIAPDAHEAKVTDTISGDLASPPDDRGMPDLGQQGGEERGAIGKGQCLGVHHHVHAERAHQLERLVGHRRRRRITHRHRILERAIVAFRIEFLSLENGIEDAEERRCVCTASGDPLPVLRIVCEVGIHERVPEPFLAVPPMDQKMLHQQ